MRGRGVCTILRLAGISRSPDGINQSRVNRKRTANIVKMSFISSSSRLQLVINPREISFARETSERIIVDKIRNAITLIAIVIGDY